ncbi:MAG: hypothetical protein LC632_02375 [Xanthomonadaceae bacterium]|nr:hypothetical protein [Xanthomonadaceae bacterium]
MPNTIRAGMLAAVLAMLLPSMQVSAADGEPGRVKLSGFGTLGFVGSSEDSADYVAGQFRPTGAGYTNTWSHEVDSRLGAQLTVAFSDRWTGIVQAMVEQRYDDSYEPVIEWANLRYALTPDFSVSVGRVVLPTFMVADTRKVSYANPWVRPPPELYSLSPMTSSDGVELRYRTRTGSWTHTTDVTVGQGYTHISPGVTVEAGSQFGVYQTAEAGAWKLRASYLSGELRLAALDPLFDAFRMFGPAGADIAERFAMDGDRGRIWTVGASYEPLDWFVMAEIGKVDTQSVIGASTAGYISAGRRFGAITPYATYARIYRNGPTTTPGLDLSSLPPDLAAVGAQLNAGLNAFMATTAEQSTLSAGVRWDFRSNMAFKFQYDYIEVADGSNGMFTNLQPDHLRGECADIISISLDFVF